VRNQIQNNDENSFSKQSRNGIPDEETDNENTNITNNTGNNPNNNNNNVILEGSDKNSNYNRKRLQELEEKYMKATPLPTTKGNYFNSNNNYNTPFNEEKIELGRRSFKKNVSITLF